MKIAIGQMDIAWEDKDSNLKKIAELTSRASIQGADLIIFPEMSVTGFSMNSVSLAEQINGPSVQNVCNIAKQYNIFIVFGMPTIQNGHYYNSLIVINRHGEYYGIYNKIHTFSYAAENNHYSNGNELPLFKLGEITFGVAICYDLRFPEMFTIKSNEKQLSVVIANWPKERIEHWKNLVRSRALDSLSYVVAVNRVGSGGGLDYSGGSIIIDPWGNTVIECEDYLEEIKIAQIDLSLVSKIRSKLAVLNDRQPHIYNTLSLPKEN